MAELEASEAVEFVRLVGEADSTNRADGLDDLKFSYGDQWPAEKQNRVLEDRPALTINETDSYCRQITNAMRQQRPRIKVHPVDGLADVKIAQTIEGLTRHVEVNSNADIAYDLMGDMAVRVGWGYCRVTTDYVREDRFEQDIFIQDVPNIFSVYFDPNSMALDGSDSERCVITDEMPLTQFRKEFPDARDAAGFLARATGDQTAQWVSKENIRLAEYFRVVRTPWKLVALSDGTTIYPFYEGDPRIPKLIALGLTVKGDRASYKRVVKWHKQSAWDILDEKDWPGRWIPVIPCYGVRVFLDGKMKKMGAVRFARDPQLMVNFWNTAVTECVAQAPKAKWLIAEGQNEGHENEFATANVRAFPVLAYKPVMHESGQLAPPPQRLQPEGPPEGILVALGTAGANLQRVMGVYDPESGKPSGGNKSGKAIRAEQGQSQQSNYHFYDNETVSIKHVGRIILDLAPKVWDTERVMRIIKPDGKPDTVTINERQAVGKVLNDVTVGNYDVEMETGPGYNTKREEGVEVFTQLMGTPLGEKIAGVADDLVVRMMDVHGADAIADRLAAANPLSQIDDKSDVPPQAQMMIKGLQAKLQQAMQALQQAGVEIKFGLQKQQVHEDAETKRTLIKATADAHDTETRAQSTLQVERAENEAWMHDVALKAQTQLTVTEINAMVKLLTEHVKAKGALQQIERQAELAPEPVATP